MTLIIFSYMSWQANDIKEGRYFFNINFYLLLYFLDYFRSKNVFVMFGFDFYLLCFNFIKHKESPAGVLRAAVL